MMHPRQALRMGVLMKTAEAVSELGTCNRLRVGAVITRGGRIISTGYNGAPSGMDHCHHETSDEPCRISVHAEANAIAFAARLGGVGTNDATLFVTHAPCWECAKLIINSGIHRVVYQHPYRLTEGLELLENAGILVHKWD